MVAIPNSSSAPVAPDALEQLEDIICGLSDCLRALLNLSRHGPLLHLIETGLQTDNRTTENAAPPRVRYSAFAVEDFEDAEGAEQSHWRQVGAAIPHRDGKGFSVQLAAIPVDGKLVIRAQETST